MHEHYKLIIVPNHIISFLLRLAPIYTKIFKIREIFELKFHKNFEKLDSGIRGTLKSRIILTLIMAN